MRIPFSSAALGACVAASAFVLDQTTKAVAVANADLLTDGFAVVPGFNLVLVRNSGVSFGMLGDVPWWALALVALAVCGWLAVLMTRTRDRGEAAGYGLIIGGALGNIVDRGRLGGVTDFLDFYVGSAHWPAFNCADMGIFCGAAILIWSQLFSARRESRAS